MYDKIAKEIIKSLPNKNKIKTTPSWFGKYYWVFCKNWQSTPDIWAKINDGSLADLIMKEIDELYKNIVKHNIKIDP